MRNPTLATILTLTLVTLSTLGAGCASKTDSDDEEPVESGEQALTSNERTAFQFFVNKGLTKTQAAGVIGNLMQESNVMPGAVEPGGAGRGIAQWSAGGRWNADHDDNVFWYASTHGGTAGSLTTQLDFIWYELETFPGYGLGRLRASNTITSATLAFQTDFEACGKCEQSTRIRYAENALSEYGGAGGSSGGAGTTMCYSSTLGKEMPLNACVQSRSNDLWYQCDHGSWVDRWSDPTACNGVHPL